MVPQGQKPIAKKIGWFYNLSLALLSALGGDGGGVDEYSCVFMLGKSS